MNVSTLMLVPVKGKGSFVHFVRRCAKLGFEASLAALCGKLGPLDRYARPKWRRAKAAKAVCQTCHQKAVVLNGRVDWS